MSIYEKENKFVDIVGIICLSLKFPCEIVAFIQIQWCQFPSFHGIPCTPLMRGVELTTLSDSDSVVNSTLSSMETFCTESDRLYKVSFVTNHLKRRFAEEFTPHQEVAVDECMILFLATSGSCSITETNRSSGYEGVDAG